MHVAVLTASPGAGETSISHQFARWLERTHPEHTWVTHHLGRGIRRLERDPAALQAVLDDVRAADLVLWTTPIYYLLVPAPLVHFLELVAESDAFAGTYATTLSTSVRFYDHTAHSYLHAVSEDLGMQAIDGWSAHMEDLKSHHRRAHLDQWFSEVADVVQRGGTLPRRFAPVPELPAVELPERPAVATTGDRVVEVVADGPHVAGMVAALERATAHRVHVTWLHTVDIRGGCLGCFACAWDGTCTYKDEHNTLYARLMAADAVVYAGQLQGRYWSWRFKQFFDRAFYRNHQSSLEGKPMAFLVSGAARPSPHLEEIARGYAELQRAPLVGWVTDEDGDPAALVDVLTEVGRRLDGALARPRHARRTFLGRGGDLIFRDLVYQNAGFFHADFLHYRERGRLRYPNTSLKRHLATSLLRAATLHPRTRREVYRRSRELIVSASRRIADRG